MMYWPTEASLMVMAKKRVMAMVTDMVTGMATATVAMVRVVIMPKAKRKKELAAFSGAEKITKISLPPNHNV